MSGAVIECLFIAVVLSLMIWAVIVALICQESDGNSIGPDPLSNQITLFFVGVVASCLMLIASAIVLGWSWQLLFKWGYSPFWYLIGAAQMAPPAIHAVITNMRFSKKAARLWQRPLPAALLIIWLLIGQWVSELLLIILVLVAIIAIVLSIWWFIVGLLFPQRRKRISSSTHN